MSILQKIVNTTAQQSIIIIVTKRWL